MVWLISLPTLLIGQDIDFWVQVEAHPNQAAAINEARTYSNLISDVNAFDIGAGWFAVSIGPFDETEAQAHLFELRSAGVIPLDSFLSRGSNHQDRIWPVSSTRKNMLQTLAPVAVEKEVSQLPSEPDETLEEARQSERTLSRDEKKQLQIALKSAGYYSSAIDGDFGPGTRLAMRAWQNDTDLPLTGVLTTAQREFLLWQYNRVLESSGVKRVSDTNTGVALNLPLELVTFSKYEPPLAHFSSTTGDAHAAYVISQEGDRDSLRDLYKALQTLAILPKSGERTLKANRFEISGKNDEIVSYARATLQNDTIKGFILVWPVGDEERRLRLLAEMKASFTRFDGVLNANIGSNASQKIDLLFGLDIKKPAFVRSGIFVSTSGYVVTAARNLSTCTRITVENNYEASVAKTDVAERIALLKTTEKIVPKAVAELSSSVDGIGDFVIGSGFSFGGRLSAPSLISGRIKEVQSLTGNLDYIRMAMVTRDSDSGGPVLNRRGTLSGIIVNAAEDGRKLPENVSYALKADKVVELMRDASLYVTYEDTFKPLNDILLAQKARDMTGLISCWKD